MHMTTNIDTYVLNASYIPKWLLDNFISSDILSYETAKNCNHPDNLAIYTIPTVK